MNYSIIGLILLLFSPVLMLGQWEKYQNLDFSQDAPDSLSGKAYWRTIEAVQIVPERRGAERNPCVKISGDYTGDHTGYVYQQYPVAVQEYVKLKISASIKGENITDGKGYIYSYSKKGEQFLQYQTLDATAIRGTEDWKQVELSIWVGPEADRLRIGGALEGKGTLYLDDFSVEEIETGTCDFADSTLAFMDECVELIARLSLHKDEIEPDQLLRRWQRFSACPQSASDIHDGLNMMLKTVDTHSFFWPVEMVNKWQNTSQNPATAQFPLAKGYRLDDHYAYLWMPHFNSGDSLSQIVFADHMQGLIDSLDHPALKGWVLDLRDNQGGNCWPMLAGIGPILGEGVCGYFKDGEEWRAWAYRDGMTYESGDSISGISRSAYVPHISTSPVAVLIGPMTVSSGEVVTVAFCNRPQTRLFGQHTGGYSTGNVNHTMSDGSMMFLTQSIYADRNQQTYRKGIAPDVEIPRRQEGEEDQALMKALSWLKGI
ncbi:MAG: S41 family peptidase [Bacteroidota bacterium]